MATGPDEPSEFLYPDEVFRIRGAIFEVNREMGSGFLEGVYQECLALEFAARGMPFTTTPSLPLTYKGRRLVKTYMPDFVCFSKIIVELKAVGALAAEHRSQVLNYLKGGGFRVGLLVNFGSTPKAQVERFVL